MNIFPLTIRRVSAHSRRSNLVWTLFLALAFEVPLASRGADVAMTFATPDEAAASLAEAVRTENAATLRSIFGPEAQEFQNPDRVQATNEFRTFAAALDQTFRLNHTSDTRCVLEVGADFWPFPIPIVKQDGRWLFDSASGKEELLNRRIGQNELAVLEVMRAYVDAQREYASRDRDGDDVLEYAQKISSSAGQTDGLYWPPELNGQISPLGPLVARAQTVGYDLGSRHEDDVPDPFNGYYFKILTRQGRHAPGGKYSYLINGNMIGGFALVAWPARYGDSGIMTFMVNQQGVVYQKDLGPKTQKLAAAMKAYDPDIGWVRSPD